MNFYTWHSFRRKNIYNEFYDNQNMLIRNKIFNKYFYINVKKKLKKKESEKKTEPSIFLIL